MPQKFWMVLGSGTPTYRHVNLKSATDEAERLATMHPGHEFVVLEALAVCKKTSIVWQELEGYEPDGTGIPF